MSTRKTNQDIKREDIAAAINARLKGTDLNVAAGGRKGPFTLSISRLSHDRLLRLIDRFLDDEEE